MELGICFSNKVQAKTIHIKNARAFTWKIPWLPQRLFYHKKKTRIRSNEKSMLKREKQPFYVALMEPFQKIACSISCFSLFLHTHNNHSKEKHLSRMEIDGKKEICSNSRYEKHFPIGFFSYNLFDLFKLNSSLQSTNHSTFDKITKLFHYASKIFNIYLILFERENGAIY